MIWCAELIRRSRDVVGQEGVVPENLHPPNGGQGEAVREVVNNENPGLVANDPAAAGVVPAIRWINEVIILIFIYFICVLKT